MNARLSGRVRRSRSYTQTSPVVPVRTTTDRTRRRLREDIGGGKAIASRFAGASLDEKAPANGIMSACQVGALRIDQPHGLRQRRQHLPHLRQRVIRELSIVLLVVGLETEG